MDLTAQVALIGSVAGFSVAIISIYGLLRGRAVERDQRRYLEELQFRETQLKYEHELNADVRRGALDMAWSTLRVLEDLEVARGSEPTSEAFKQVRELRALQYYLISLLTESSSRDRKPTSLDQLGGLLDEQRLQFDGLLGEEGRRLND